MSGNSDICYSFWEPEGFVFKQSKTKTYSLYNMKQRKRHIRTFEKLEITHLWEFIKLLAGLSNVLSFTPPCLFLDGIQYVQYSMSS